MFLISSTFLNSVLLFLRVAKLVYGHIGDPRADVSIGDRCSATGLLPSIGRMVIAVDLLRALEES
jgi:hypothetical protein